MQKKIVAIHQPNLFPWLGYFYKIYLSDAFIILDDVQMQKTGSNYTNRSAILNVNGSTNFLTIPVPRPTGTQLIRDVRIIDESWRKKFSGTIQANYSRAAFYKKNRDLIIDLINRESSSLNDFNQTIIFEIFTQLKIGPREFSSSSSHSLNSSSTERLVDLVKAVNGNTYLSGNGGVNYQDEEIYTQNNIELSYVNYPSFNYDQIGSPVFVTGLSIIDAIFNIDYEGIREIFQAIPKT